MDIVSPELLRIGKCCYRLPALENQEHQPAKESTLLPYNEEFHDGEGDSLCAVDAEDMEAEEQIEVLQNGRLRLELPIAKIYFPMLIGFKGTVKRRIEEETRVRINIPRPTESGPIAILGDQRRQVLLAKAHVQSIVEGARQKISPTHFVGIPALGDIEDNFAKFKEAAMKICPEIPEKAYSSSCKLHFTFTVMLLADDRDRQMALDVMHQLQPIIIGKLSGLKCEVKGISTFSDSDPARCSVLFAKLSDPAVQEVANEVAERFYSAGLVKQKDHKVPVTLHLTVLNSRNLKEDEEEEPRGGRRRFSPRQTFDVRPLLQEMHDFNFGLLSIDSVQLSQMKSYGPSGYYLASYTLPL